MLWVDLAVARDGDLSVELGRLPLDEAEAWVEARTAANESSEEVDAVTEALSVVSADDVLDRTVTLPPATPLAPPFEIEADEDADPLPVVVAGWPFPPPILGAPMIIKGLPTPPGLITAPGSPLRTTPSPRIFKLSFAER